MIKEYRDRNGNLFIIRPITPEDKKYLQLGFSELTAESRRQRFQLGKKELSESELKYLTELDEKTHMAFVVYLKAETLDLPAGVIRGIQDVHRNNMLEIAITIIDQYQNHGLGIVLLELFSEWALANGYTHFIGDMHNSNNKMIKLLQKFSKTREPFLATHVGDGFLYFEIPLKKC